MAPQANPSILLASLCFLPLVVAPFAAGPCYTVCNGIYGACVAAFGLVPGTFTHDASTGIGLIACSASQGTCMVGCFAIDVTVSVTPVAIVITRSHYLITATLAAILIVWFNRKFLLAEGKIFIEWLLPILWTAWKGTHDHALLPLVRSARSAWKVVRKHVHVQSILRHVRALAGALWNKIKAIFSHPFNLHALIARLASILMPFGPASGSSWKNLVLAARNLWVRVKDIVRLALFSVTARQALGV